MTRRGPKSSGEWQNSFECRLQELRTAHRSLADRLLPQYRSPVRTSEKGLLRWSFGNPVNVRFLRFPPESREAGFGQIQS